MKKRRFFRVFPKKRQKARVLQCQKPRYIDRPYPRALLRTSFFPTKIAQPPKTGEKKVQKKRFFLLFFAFYSVFLAKKPLLLPYFRPGPPYRKTR